MVEFKGIEELKAEKDVVEALEKIKKLEAQRKNPNRKDMIQALADAKDKAPLEITVVEFAQGGTQWMPFECFSDEDLYRKLLQYQQGLEAYCIEKVGKQVYEQLRQGKE